MSSPSAPGTDRLRLSVLGVDGNTSHVTVDAAVSPIRLLEALAVGPAAVRRLAGGPLVPDRTLAEQEVPSGACLVLEPVDAEAVPDGEAEAVLRPAGEGRTSGIVLAAVGCFVLAALVVAVEVVAGTRGGVDGGPGAGRLPDARAVGIGAVLVAVLAAVVAVRVARGARALAPARMALPLLAGAVVAFAAIEPGPGELLLALTAAAVTVAGAAAFLRADGRVGRGSVAEAALSVEAVLGAATAAATGTALLTDVPLAACAALVAGTALPVLRLLPGAILRVPERLLLDVDAVTVSAWSPPSPAPTGAGSSVSRTVIDARIRRDRRLLDAAVVGLVGTVVTCLAVVLTDRLGGTAATLEEEITTIALAVGTAGGLALAARAVRGRMSKVALVCGAVAVPVALVAAALTGSSPGDGTRLVVAPGVGVLGLVVGGLALAWGTGRRSLRWGRIGDLAESAAVVLTPGLALVAAGGWAWMRALVS